MRILIGGSPSTGSSLLRQVLNRHPQIFCGPETNMFCYSALYQRWIKARYQLLRRGPLRLRRTDVRHVSGVMLEDPEFGWSRSEIRRLIAGHETFTDFADAFFSRPLQVAGKTHWAEKTPANVLMFPVFAHNFEDSHCIHIFRNPYDTVTSLVARGMSAYEAASIYLLYTAHGLVARTLPGYREIRYESLVHSPEDTLTNAILEPLGLAFSPQMLTEGNARMTTPASMQGWLSDETEAITAKSVLRYERQDERSQILVATALWALRLTQEHAAKYELQHDTLESICSALNYPFINSADRIDTGLLPVFQDERRRIMARLARYRYLSESIPYPVVIYSEP